MKPFPYAGPQALCMRKDKQMSASILSTETVKKIAFFFYFLEQKLEILQ